MATDYWKNRELKSREQLLDEEIHKLEKAVIKAYRSVSDHLLKELERYYLKIQDKPLTSYKYVFNKDYEVYNLLTKSLKKLGNTENQLLSEELKNLYITNSKVISPEHIFFDEDKAKEAIKEIWVDDGKSFSDRIWTDKAQLRVNLEKSLTSAILTGKSPDVLVKDLMNNMSASYSNAKRLIVTELAHIHIKSTIDTYKKLGITKYRYLTAKDERVCNECNENNEKLFDIDDTEHLPPLHPRCRCTILRGE